MQRPFFAYFSVGVSIKSVFASKPKDPYPILIFCSFERYIRICFYCQLRETSVLSEENVKFYKLFVILFPMLFYIPKCFEVRSQYVVKEVKMRIDCQKYLSLSQLLENPLLKSFLGQQFTESDLVKIDFLAKACNKIIR